MQVILLDKIANLGGLGDQVVVKSGFARNFLFPQGKAVPATKANIETFDARRAELEAKIADQLVAAQARADKLEALPLGTIRETGEFDVSIAVHSEVTATIKVIVIAEA